MTYSARNRDRYRVVASATTGAVAAVCLAGTGAVMGTAAAANAQSEHDKAAARERELNAQPMIIEVARPTAKVTRIKTVTKPGKGPRIRVVSSRAAGRARTGSSSAQAQAQAPRHVLRIVTGTLVEQVRWQSLGTYVQLSVSDPDKVAAAERRARALLAAVDWACSRFREDSELHRVNAGAGTWVRVDPLLVAATVAAVEAAEHTDGIVHPLLGKVMIGLGYDRTFAELQPGTSLEARIEPPPLGAWRSIEWEAGAIRIPAGTALDLGATAKAWAGDVISRTIAEEERANVLLSLGGDVAIARGDRSPTWWPIAIREHPEGEASAEVALTRGGLATSSTRLRRWTVAGVTHHHLVDPRTGALCTDLLADGQCHRAVGDRREHRHHGSGRAR